MPVSKGRTAGRAVSRVSTFLPRIQVSSPLPFTVLIQFFRLVHKSELDTDALGIQLIRYIYIYIYLSQDRTKGKVVSRVSKALSLFS